MNNEDKFYRDLIKKFFDNFYYFIKKHPQDRKPQSKEEKILLPFLLQWMKERKDRKIIKDEFNQVYKKGWIPIYSEENVQKMDAYLLCTGITYSVCEMLIANKLIDSKEDIYNLFISVPTLGPFLAYQYAIDIAYSEFSDAKESDFIIAGPGAIRGIHKCFKNISPKQYSSVIFWMYENQNKYLKGFTGINNHKLQLIDCQNIFCEVDKYLRIVLPELTSNRKKIKQVYKPNLDRIKIQTPKKWNLNQDSLFMI